MKKLFAAALLAIVVSQTACITIQTPYGAQRYSPLQQRVQVTVINDCAPFLDGGNDFGPVFTGLPFGKSVPVILARDIGGSAQLNLMVVARKDTTYLGSDVRSYYTDASQPVRFDTWKVMSVNTASGSGCSR